MEVYIDRKKIDRQKLDNQGFDFDDPYKQNRKDIQTIALVIASASVGIPSCILLNTLPKIIENLK